MAWSRRQLGLACLLVSANALAQRAPAYSPPPYIPPPPPDVVHLDGVLYEGTVGGMRDYVETLRETRPSLFKRLDARVSTLEWRRIVGWSMALGGALGGVALFFATQPSDEARHSGTANYTGEYIALGVLAVVPLTGYLVIPGNDDIRNFVLYRNRVASDPEVRVVPWRGRGGGGLTASFVF